MSAKQVEVTTSYPFEGNFDKDKVAINAVGRSKDFSGRSITNAGFGNRDLGWVCDTWGEAEKIKAALEGVGLVAKIVQGEG